ncbi:MAG: amino acid permease, partial [Phycisphaerae bacterium]|nr:amino acid permease [Phycisphaerae bacterium]
MMGLGMMIGAGVFIGIGISMREAGPGGVLLTFALTGLIALFTAMSFAELSSAIPRAGGAYNFARIAFGRGPSFLAGWMEWFASCVAGSLYAVVFATYTLRFFTALGLLDWVPIHIELLERLVAIAVAGFFLYINYRGASETGKVGVFFTLGQMLFVLSIAAAGIITAILDPQRIENFRPFLNPDGGWVNLLATMGFIYVAFEGFEVI